MQILPIKQTARLPLEYRFIRKMIYFYQTFIDVGLKTDIDNPKIYKTICLYFLIVSFFIIKKRPCEMHTLIKNAYISAH